MSMASQLLFCGYTVAVKAEILDIGRIIDADVTTLQRDIDLFNNIGAGIELVVADCEGQDICEPPVHEIEIKNIIGVLEERINEILLRQQEAEAELADIVIAYVESKEKYIAHLNNLSEIAAPDELLVEDIFFNDADVFEDFDDELEDDEDNLGRLEEQGEEEDI